MVTPVSHQVTSTRQLVDQKCIHMSTYRSRQTEPKIDMRQSCIVHSTSMMTKVTYHINSILISYASISFSSPCHRVRYTIPCAVCTVNREIWRYFSCFLEAGRNAYRAKFIESPICTCQVCVFYFCFLT